MKKNIIAAIIAASCFSVSGVSLANTTSILASHSTDVTTNVTAVTGATITVTPTPETVTTEQAATNGVKLASLTVDATGISNGVSGASNVKVTVDSSHYSGDSAGQYWVFKDANGNGLNSKVQGTEWQNNGDNVTHRTDSVTTYNGSFDLVTAGSNTNVQPGVYTLPVTATITAW
ncbi:TPA: Dr family adhesin structural subunit [Escherichia coli]|nr:Dr family adhesin structural subunit [Escherichia coli]